MKPFFRFLVFVLLVHHAGPSAFADESGAKDLTIEEYLQRLSTVTGVMTRLDPFTEMAPPFHSLIADQAQTEDPFAPVEGAPLMERYAVPDYEVIAVLLGDKYSRALVRMPAEGTGSRRVVIVHENDKLGKAKGVVSKIVREGVIVQQAQLSRGGFSDRTEALLKVGGRSEEQRRSLKAKVLN